MHNRRTVLGLLAIPPVLAATGLPARAREAETFQTNGLAIHGYDPVGYFTDSAPIEGSPDHAVSHKGAIWRFASAANQAAFEGDPEKYGARFGGYCAWAASRGYIAPTVPEAWTIHENRLYLNYSIGVRRRWLRNIDANIRNGEANWPGILG